LELRLLSGWVAACSRELGRRFERRASRRRRACVTLREVSFIYKRIWQHGLLRVEQDGEVSEAPFRVAVRLEVDLAQNDRAS